MVLQCAAVFIHMCVIQVCGTPIVDVDLLKKMTEHNLPHKEKHPVAIMFWQVVGGMQNSDRAALLAFASGRRRLPSHNSGGHFKIELLHGRGDEALPEAHTCFFTIDLPHYSSTCVMRDKLLYAIHNCSVIDKDFTARGGASYDPEDDYPPPNASQPAAAKRSGVDAEGNEGRGGAGLLSSLAPSPPVTPGAAGEEGGGCGGGVPLTAERLKGGWSRLDACLYVSTNAQQFFIPRDGGHDDCTDVFGAARGTAGGGEVSAEHLHDTRDLVFEGVGVGAGAGEWDPGMLDRMQAADVYSGMSGIDQVSDSANGSDSDDEDADSDEMLHTGEDYGEDDEVDDDEDSSGSQQTLSSDDDDDDGDATDVYIEDAGWEDESADGSEIGLDSDGASRNSSNESRDSQNDDEDDEYDEDDSDIVDTDSDLPSDDERDLHMI